MDDIRNLVRSAINESLYERPFGIAYTAAVVEGWSDRQKLYEAFEAEISKAELELQGWHHPDDYHMTICFGELPLSMKVRGDLNSEVHLRATHLGISDEAIAFRVEGFMSKNDMQHITMLFKHRPADSNSIRNWKELDRPFTVSSVIREVPAKRP